MLVYQFYVPSVTADDRQAARQRCKSAARAGNVNHRCIPKDKEEPTQEQELNYLLPTTNAAEWPN